jgi:hypothetical protein
MNTHLKFLAVTLLLSGLPACSSVLPGLKGRPQAKTSLQGASVTELAGALADANKAMQEGLSTQERRQAYATQVGRVVALWLALSDASARSAAMDVDGGFRIVPQIPRGLRFDELIPSNTIRSRHLKHRMTRDGVGTPMVAHWHHTPERKAREAFMSDGGYLCPVTATLDFRKSAGRRVVSLVLHDSRVTQTVRLGGHEMPLAADLTSYGEYLLSMEAARMGGIKALLRSSSHMDKLGLIALEPPAKDRIPLILVHGLMSRPATWENVINEFGTNPDIQRHYQVYLFRYPSGVPIIYSSQKLRENLAQLHDILSRSGAGRRCANMVLIGHSMGGLVSKAQVQDSGDRFWVTILGKGPQELGLKKEELESLRRYLEFNPNPHISRVIFAATPHRGSDVADSRLARFGRRLVKLPGQTFGSTFDILQGLAERNQSLGQLLARGMPTSVDNLSPSSPYVRIATTLPFRSGVHLHSIIGNKDGRPTTDPKCSDGFVPYSSAHLDGVESELLVKSDHSVHERPEAIEEMRRILKLHLRMLNLQ